MRARLQRLHPFTTPDAQRLALLFGIVYFAQGMWYLPNQTITIVLKERGLTAAEAAGFFAISVVPWLVKPVYGLISDFIPLFGRRRKSYFLLMSALAGAAGASLALMGEHGYWPLASLFTVMGLGLAFTDVLTDALMVEHGRPRGLTGAFQSVQWAAIYTAAILTGVVGGHFAELRSLGGAFLVATAFPLISLTMGVAFIHEPPARARAEAFHETWGAIREAFRERSVWVVAGFVLFWTFSPSFGPALLYYQTDLLGFSQRLIGGLDSLRAAAAVAGAVIYAPLSRRVPLRRLINVSIGIGVATNLAYLGYRDPWSAASIELAFGCLGMIVQLAFLDLAAKSCPPRVEATFFALLMSVYNAGMQGSQIVGGALYDRFGFAPLIWVSAAVTAAAWLLVPLVRIDRIEARARAQVDAAGAGQRGVSTG